MPIDYTKYPDNWKTEIRPRILKRAENCCELCGVSNYEWISRSTRNSAVRRSVSELHKECHDSLSEEYRSIWRKPIRVVLTIAHLDHDLTHNEDGNLMALCQRCHLWYDKNEHARNRRK